MQISDHATEELEDWDSEEPIEDESERSAWAELAQPASEDVSDEDAFWAKVPEHLGDGTLLEDAEDDRWIDKLKKKLPVTKDPDTKAEENGVSGGPIQ
jgi:hypothetical protein